MRTTSLTFFFLLSFVALLPTFTPVQAQSSLAVQPSQTPGGWAAVEALPPHAEIHLRTDRRKLTCHIDAVTPDTLSCANSTFARSNIGSIKLTRRSASTAGGLLIGAGIGAGVGVGIGSAINAGDKGSFTHVSAGKAAGVGAGVGAIIGIAAGAIIGHSKDIFATTIYRR